VGGGGRKVCCSLSGEKVVLALEWKRRNGAEGRGYRGDEYTLKESTRGTGENQKKLVRTRCKAWEGKGLGE